MYEEIFKEAMKLDEASTSRTLDRLTNPDSVCAIISPYRGEYSEKENKQRMIKLKSEVRKLGYGFNQFVSRWVEDGEAFDEESLLIPDIPFRLAYQLGKQFEQSSIIYKDSKALREICTTAFETYKPTDVVRTFNNSGNHVLNIKDAQEIFSRRKGGPVSMPKKGSNKKPFTLKIKENYELYEKHNPRPSYFQTEPYYTRII